MFSILVSATSECVSVCMNECVCVCVRVHAGKILALNRHHLLNLNGTRNSVHPVFKHALSRAVEIEAGSMQLFREVVRRANASY